MSHTAKRLLIPHLLLLVSVAIAGPLPDTPDAGMDSCLAAGCHAERTAGAVVHPPTAEGLCDVCHEPTGEGHRFRATADPIAEVCTGCHEDPVAGRPRIHAPVEAGECTLCHDPHASPNPALLLTAGAGLCLDCHGEDIAPGPGRTGHPVAKHPVEGPTNPAEPGKLFWCASCHDPHAATARALLRVASGTSFCGRCHAK